MDSASDAVDKILDFLDKHVSPSLNSRYGLKMNLFRCLYAYNGKFQYMGYLVLSEAMKKISEIFDLSEITLYDYKFNSLIDTDRSLADTVSLLIDSISTKVITYPDTRESKGGITLSHILKRIRQRPLHSAEKLVGQLISELRYRVFSKEKKTILVYGHLYELDFLVNNLDRYNVLFYSQESGVPVGFKHKEFVSKGNVNYGGFNIGVEGRTAAVFLRDLKSDFSRNIHKYLNSVLMLRDIQNKYPISLGIWGLGPTNRIKAFIIEYLRSEAITVLGAQHGCLFGDSYKPWHFDAEFHRCSQFISYGFTKEDLKRLYPDKGRLPEILPLGKVKLPDFKKAKKTIDILFPLQSSTSMFEGGMDATLPHTLTERQIAILNYLNGLKGLKIYVKPFMNSGYDNCSVLPVLKKMNNLTVVYDMVLLEFLERYHPAAIIMELPSQPLFEVLHMDSEIFLMNCELHPYEEQALSELLKRVHYAYDTTKLIDMLELYLSGRLQKKRDQTFFHHYVYKEHTKTNIYKLIDRLSAGRR